MADRLIKYMGTSHVHILEKGETFDGRYPDGLPDDLVFDQSNKWVQNVGDLPDDAADLIAEDPSFFEVTDLKRVPDNEHQKMFHPRVQNASDLAQGAVPAFDESTAVYADLEAEQAAEAEAAGEGNSDEPAEASAPDEPPSEGETGEAPDGSAEKPTSARSSKSRGR